MPYYVENCRDMFKRLANIKFINSYWFEYKVLKYCTKFLYKPIKACIVIVWFASLMEESVQNKYGFGIDCTEKQYCDKYHVLTELKDTKSFLISDGILFALSLLLHYSMKSKVYAFGMQQIAPSVMGLDLIFLHFAPLGTECFWGSLVSLTNCTIWLPVPA